MILHFVVAVVFSILFYFVLNAHTHHVFSLSLSLFRSFSLSPSSNAFNVRVPNSFLRPSFYFQFWRSKFLVWVHFDRSFTVQCVKYGVPFHFRVKLSHSASFLFVFIVIDPINIYLFVDLIIYYRHSLISLLVERVCSISL